MPIYDYICQQCEKAFEIKADYEEYERINPRCSHCGSANVARKIGRIRVIKGDRSRLSAMSQSAELNHVDDDPRALGRMMREMKEQTGAKMDPAFDDVVGRLEKGDSIEAIDRDYQE